MQSIYRLGPLALLVAALGVGLVSAGEPPPPVVMQAAEVVGGPNLAVPDQSCSGCNPSASHWRLSAWRRKPTGCYPADIGCSSLKSECIFFFGSCRQFFGEPCLKGPPPPPPLYP